MKIRKFFRGMAYVLFSLLIVWAISIQSGCFSMRSTDAEWEKKLKEKGQTLAPQFLDVQAPDGRRIHAVTIGHSDTLPLILMVHGSPGASDAFLDYFADTALTRMARLVSLDRPGFGFTSGFGSPEPDLGVQVSAVQAIKERLAPFQKIFLIGHSSGGPIIAKYAMQYPDQTAGLVIVAGSVDPELEAHPWWQGVVHVPPVKWLIPKPLWTSNAEIIPLQAELEKMLPFWPAITCPVRVVHANNDRLVPIANADFIKKMLVNCQDLKMDILPDGDHFILWSRPDRIREALLDLIRHPSLQPSDAH